VACGEINDCDDNINITLPPGNHSYVLDNFNLTELTTTRENSPIWFSLNQSETKHIASNLTDTINLTVVLNVTKEPEQIVYLSDTGAYSYTLTSDNWSYSVANNDVTINLTGIEPASSSNVLTLTYDYDNPGDLGGGANIPTHCIEKLVCKNETHLAYQTTNCDLSSITECSSGCKDDSCIIPDNQTDTPRKWITPKSIWQKIRDFVKQVIDFIFFWV
jgi:hypothetical protein